MGAQYLRECESVAHAQYEKKKALNVRGTSISLSDIVCDYDGRYGYIAVVEKIVYIMSEARKFILSMFNRFHYQGSMHVG